MVKGALLGCSYHFKFNKTLLISLYHLAEEFCKLTQRKLCETLRLTLRNSAVISSFNSAQLFGEVSQNVRIRLFG